MNQIKTSLKKVIDCGYDFVYDAISPAWCQALEKEVALLKLEEGDHINYPINPGTSREVRQLHARMYVCIPNYKIPIASAITYELVNRVLKYVSIYPSLSNWLPNEAGYQLYRDNRDCISPHRDRRNDQLLSATITITGSAWVRMFEPLEDPDDYSKLKLIDQFKTKPGSIMWLRAPGLGNGNQIIHEVLPPKVGNRLILNLRMRPDILKSPSEFAIT